MRRASAAFLLGTAATAATSTACATFGPSAMTRVPADTQDPGARELTCLDVAAHPLGRERHESVSSLNVLYEFANRCARPVHLDFAAVPVDVRLSDERRERLVPEPVTGGRVSGTLDAFASGTEKIGYLASAATEEQTQSIRAFCVDLSRLEADSAAGARPVCFRRLQGVYASVDSLDDDVGKSSAVEVTAQPLETSNDSDSGLTCTDVLRGTSTATYCNQFGLWERKPPVMASMGLSTHRFNLSRRTVNGGDGFGAPDALSGAPLGAAQALSFDLDVDGFIAGPLYVGGELQIGGNWFAHDATLSDNPHLGVGSGSLYMSGGAVVGAALPRLGPIGVRAEVYGGGAVLQGTPDDASTQLAAYQNSCTGDGCPTTWIPTWVLEPRVRLNAWISPWVSLDGWGGLGVAESGDWSGGLALTFHARSFDGRP